MSVTVRACTPFSSLLDVRLDIMSMMVMNVITLLSQAEMILVSHCGIIL